MVSPDTGIGNFPENSCEEIAKMRGLIDTAGDPAIGTTAATPETAPECDSIPRQGGIAMGGISAFAYPGAGARRLLIGGGEIMPALQRGIGRAHRDFTGEIFVLNDPMTVRNLNAQARDGVRLRFLVDPERFSEQSRGSLPRGVHRESVPMPGKVHAKAFAADENWGMVSTLPPVKGADFIPGSYALEVEGPGARAIADVTKAGIADDAAASRAASAVAAEHGILVNDARFGIDYLTQGMNYVVDSATGRLEVVLKAMNDVPFARRIAAAARERDLQVHVVTMERHLSPKVRRILEDAPGIELQTGTESRILHGNAIVADRSVAYIGSGHATSRAMGRESASRRSREMGAIIDEPADVSRLLGVLDDARPENSGPWGGWDG